MKPTQKDYDDLLESVQYKSLQTIMEFLETPAVPVEHRVSIAADIFTVLSKANNQGNIAEALKNISDSAIALYPSLTGKTFGN